MRSLTTRQPTQIVNSAIGWFQRATPFLLLAIVVLGGLLRVFQIGDKGLWIDEAFSIWLGWQPVGEMLGWVIRIDQHPPLYYLLLHFWMALGDDAATVRALSALCGTLTIPIIYLLGRHLADEKVGLLAALILAVSPFHVRLAQETRMYTVLALNVSLALYALARLLTDPRSTEVRLGRQFVDLWRTWQATRTAERGTPPETTGHGRDFQGTAARVSALTRHCWLSLHAIETDLAWLGYIVFTTATLLSHNTAVFFPVATNLFILGLLLMRGLGGSTQIRAAKALKGDASPRPWSKTRRYKPIKPEAQSAALQPPSLHNWLLAQAGVFLLWSPWLPAFVVQSMGVYREFWLPAPTWETVAGVVGTFLSDLLPLPLPGLVTMGVLFTGLALLGLVHFRHRPARIALLLVTFATPLVGEWLVSLCRPIFYDRTLIWASFPIYLLLAAGMRQLRHRPFILTAALIVLVVNTLSLNEYYVHFEKEQWDDAAALVAERVETDDLILFNATWTQIPFDYYFYRLYNCPVAEHGVPADLFDQGDLEPKMTAGDLPRLRSLIRDHERVWLVYGHDWYTDPQGLIPSALEEERDLLDRWDFYGLQVRLYGRQRR